MTPRPAQVLFSEDELLPISAVADLVFCERRAALHVLERVWEDNVFTVEGTHLHHRVHGRPITEVRGDLRVARGVQMHSLRLGLVGKADVVEFHRVDQSAGGEGACGRVPPGAELEGMEGLWQPFPVEYKRGRLRHEQAYKVQLCAQALCLEEMLNADVPAGALYYGKSARRQDVVFDHRLRSETETAATRLHELVRSGATPKARYEKKCDKCSLISVCMPKVTGANRDVNHYLEKSLKETESPPAGAWTET